MSTAVSLPTEQLQQSSIPQENVVATATATATPPISSVNATASAPPASFPPASASAPTAPVENGAEAKTTPAPSTGSSLDEERKMEMIRGMDPSKLQNIRKRINDLHNQGLSKETSSELHKLTLIMDLYNRAKAAHEAKSTSTGDKAGSTSVAPTTAPVPVPHAAMSPAQISQLRAQAQAYQQLARNQPVPPYLLSAAQGQPPPGVAGVPSGNPLGRDIAATAVEKTVDAVISHSLENPKTSDKMEVDEEVEEKIVTPPEPIYAMEFDESSLIYPYNSFVDPSIFADRKFDAEIANPINKLQRMMVPSVMPKGLDPYLLMEERNRYIDTRMSWRMKELEGLGAAEGMENGGKDVPGITENNGETPMGVQARIELLSLRLIGKQRLLREDLVRAMHHATAVPADRSQFRRFRTHTLRDARATETQERRQRSEREQRGKQRHLSYINSICDHGRAIVDAGISTPRGATGEKMRRLGRAMLKMHADTEKEEARRLEKLAKDRLKALKADDEDAYLALLGEAKDSRIGHLLKQTDSYLETLANAVRDQQNDDVHRDQMTMDHFEVEDGPASEAMFGARRQDGEEEGAETKEGKVDYYAVAHKLQEKVTGQAKMLTGGTLKDYQVKGLQWMISLYNNRLNGILADEMGLGKTIQTISLITYLIEKKRQPGPFIVIVPLSTLTNWQMEFERWAPTVRLVVLKGSPIARRDAYPRLRALDFQVCLTTYEYIIKERPILSKIKWIHMIIDEGHRMKNVKSKLSQTLNEYYSTRYRLILTGTPLQNNLPELWALLNFVLPKIFNSVKSFDEWFSSPFANTTSEAITLTEEEQLLVVKRLHKVLRPFLLRRLKKDVESELPDKVERIIYVAKSGLQEVLYKSVKTYKTLPTDASAGKKKTRSLQNALMQLRKICNHPYVFAEVDEDFTVGNSIDDQIIRAGGKFELLDRLLPKLFNTGHKVLIFFQMTEIMTIIADFFDYRGWKYCRLDGSTKAEDRQTLLSTFNDPNSPYQVFILSTRAGGLGLNLQSADTVIIYDTDWNPHADLQAQDRAHRIGQKKEVRVLRLITSDSVEEQVLARAQSKLVLDGKVIQAGKFDDNTSGAEYEAILAKVFEVAPAGEENDSKEEEPQLSDDELNEILARGDDELAIFTQMDIDRNNAKLDAWHQAGNTGPLPPALMTKEELPAFYRRDLAVEMAEALVNAEEEGRGRRKKTDVQYTDGLTDEQWLNAVDASDDDIEDAVDRKKGRQQRMKERKAINAALEEAEADGKPLAATSIKLKPFQFNGGGDTDGPETPVGGGGGAKGKKRARPSGSVTPSIQGDDSGVKKRKTGQNQATDEEVALMRRLYDETNAQKSEEGEDLNTYFLKPVDKKAYPDYYQLIPQPICMSQIKRKLGTPSYSLQAFRSDMHLLFNNARAYNTEGSWVFNAAEDMQEFFDTMWEAEVPKLRSGGGAGAAPGGGGRGKGVPGNKALAGLQQQAQTDDSESNAPSGTTTPMFKPLTAPKIKLNLNKKKAPVVPVRAASPENSDDSEMDDNY